MSRGELKSHSDSRADDAGVHLRLRHHAYLLGSPRVDALEVVEVDEAQVIPRSTA
jgi:hypothetical protein